MAKKRSKKSSKKAIKKAEMGGRRQHHKSWCRVLRIHYIGLCAYLILGRKRRVYGVVEFTEAEGLKIGGLPVSEKNPIVFCSVGMNKMIRRKPY